MSDRIGELLKDYDDLVDLVASSTHGLYQNNLGRWFSLLDETPDFTQAVSKLELINDFDAWYLDLQTP
jgi:hypothetical protein